MGLNFYIGCHRCKEKIYLYRGRETGPMQDFWDKHRHCGSRADSVFATMPDSVECKWTEDEKDGGYRSDHETEEKHLPDHLKWKTKPINPK